MGSHSKVWGKNTELNSTVNYVGNTLKIVQEVDQSSTQRWKIDHKEVSFVSTQH